MKRWQVPHLRVLPFLILIVAVGCIAVSELAIYQTRPIRFSHAAHGQKADLSCDKCHADAKSADGIGMPNPGKCVLCHSSAEDKQTKLLPFQVEENGKKKVLFTSVTDAGTDIKFNHKPHIDKGVACNECHLGIDTSEAVSAELKVSMQQCMACHEERSAPNSCETCHIEARANVPPASHQLNWQKAHGTMARFHNDQTQNNCELCHNEQSCNTCHQQTMPRNHSQFFKQRGHGVTAAIDRENCATCHKQDSCDRCHSETAPRNHTASFMGPKNNHCLTCHQPLSTQTDSCATCHSGTPSHATATPKPAWHSPAMNCRLCHGPGLGQPLPHADNGDTCNACHN